MRSIFCPVVLSLLAGFPALPCAAEDAAPAIVTEDKTMSQDVKKSEIDYSEEALRKRLTPEQFEVTQRSGTERPFSNEYWNNKKPGLYVDVVSGEPLFTSNEKFDSGTGWPSFTAPIDKNNLVEITDQSHGMTRVEARSKKGNSHLGHVFPDGPAPTGMRYCINSSSLRFIPVEKLKEEGYEDYEKLFKSK